MKKKRMHSNKQRVLYKVCAILFAFSIVAFTVVTPVNKVSALAVPEIEPIINTTIEQLYNFVEYRLTPAQQDTFDLLLGTYAVGYAGFGQYHINYIYSTDAPLREWLINCGVDLYNTIVDLGMVSPENLKTYQSVLNVALGVAQKALTYNDVNELIDDIDNSSSFNLKITPDLMYGLNQVFASKGGLYNWQFKSQELNPLEFGFTYKYQGMSDTNQQMYVQKLLDLPLPHVRANSDNGYTYNLTFGNTFFATYNNIFVNTTTQQIVLCDDYGNQPSNTFVLNNVYYGTYNYGVYDGSGTFLYRTYSASNYTNVTDIYNDISNGLKQFIYQAYNGDIHTFAYNDFIKGLYIGANWNERVKWTNDTDLNFADNPNEYVLAPQEEILLDIKGMLDQLLDTLSLKEPVLDNITYLNLQPVPETALDKISVEVELPQSGIIIPDNLFTPVKGFMDYMWYMTKPLIVFTNDIISCLIFGEAGGFTNTGPAIFIYGVIAFGLIGGLIVKCLL